MTYVKSEPQPVHRRRSDPGTIQLFPRRARQNRREVVFVEKMSGPSSSRRAASDPDAKAPGSRRRGSREQAKQETREALVDAAMAAFSEQGLEAPSLDAICARAGYTRGAFYVHFKDRDDLIAAVMERLLRGLLDAIIATGDAALDLERTIRVFAQAAEQHVLPIQGSVSSYQFMQACSRSPALRDRYLGVLDEAVRRVAHAAREGQDAGTVRGDVDPDQVGAVLVAVVLGVDQMDQVGYPYQPRVAAVALLTMLRP